MPELPTPDDDPITSKSFALYYAVATVVLTASLFWALWDEAYGQRPWKTTQEVFQQRYTAFLKTARKKASQSQKDVEASPDYQKQADTFSDLFAYATGIGGLTVDTKPGQFIMINVTDLTNTQYIRNATDSHRNPCSKDCLSHGPKTSATRDH